MPNGPRFGTERQPECKIRPMNREPEGSVAVNDWFEIYWFLSPHNDIIHISLIMVMLRKLCD
jgi:hypothetical protein